MTNAFTQKPDTTWVRKLQIDAKISQASARRIAKPSLAQRVNLTPATAGTKFGVKESK